MLRGRISLDSENSSVKVRDFCELPPTLMSISYLKLTGPISTDDFLSNLTSDDTDACRKQHWLVDTLDCQFEFRFEDIEAMINKIKAWPEECWRDVRIALYAQSDVTYGLARIMASMADNIGLQIAVYREIADAEAYLAAA